VQDISWYVCNALTSYNLPDLGLRYVQGAPVAGYILQRYGGTDAGRMAFRPAMYYAGSMSLGSAMFTLGVRQLMTKKFFAFA
jgi:hypothetical protein